MIEGKIYANATQMCKAFPKKNLSTWVNSKGTEEYIEALCLANNKNKDFYISIKSGSPENGGGTWIYEDLVLDLARWLSIKFRLWMDEQITTLIREGSVSLVIPSYQIENPIERAKKWIEEEEERQRLALNNIKEIPQALDNGYFTYRRR